MPEAFLKLPFIPAGETVLSSVNTAAQQIAERPRHIGLAPRRSPDGADGHGWNWSTGPSAEHLIRYLQRNGIVAQPLSVELDGRTTGEMILATAQSLGCDLLCRNLAGFCFHPAGVRPARSWLFSSRLFRCVGTSTILASMICPPRAM